MKSSVIPILGLTMEMSVKLISQRTIHYSACRQAAEYSLTLERKGQYNPSKNGSMKIKPEHIQASEYIKIFTYFIFDINKKYLCSVLTIF